MSNQIVISSGAKVRSLEGVLTGSAGIVSSVPLGAANGVATLDSNGKVPLSQLPASVVTYLGTWNAATNTPTLANGTGDIGDLYICNVAGTVNFGAGPITFAVGDWVIYNGSQWQKSAGQNGTVTSVAVTESGDALTITGSPITTAGTINIGFAGNSGQYINGEGNLTTFPSIITQAQNLVTEVYNETGATLTKGTVVYINGGHGNLPTITKAIATSDATSAQTYGVVRADITNNNNGYVTVIGNLDNMDTQAYAAGTQLYLSSTTAGAYTSVKQYAPAHLVYVGIVVRSHPTQGVIEVRIQNGFELDELHNVSAQSPSNGNILQYNSSTSLWTAVAGSTSNITEGSNLYFTDARARGAISLTTTGTSGAATYNSTTGVFNIPNYGSALSGYVPYTGATADVDLGIYKISSRSLITTGTTNGGILLKQNSVISGEVDSQPYTSIKAFDTRYLYFDFGQIDTYKRFRFDALGLTDGTTITYTMPNASGTLALTSDIPSLANYVTLTGTQTITGVKTFSNEQLFGNGLTINGGFLTFADSGFSSTLDTTTLTASRAILLPNASGTLALTSDLSSYVTLASNQTVTGLKTFTNDQTFNGNIIGTTGYFTTNLVVGTSAGSSYKLDVTGNSRFTSDIRLDNGAADGAQLVLASSGFSDWNIDNFSGTLRAYYGSTVRFSLTNAGAASISDSLAIGGQLNIYGGLSGLYAIQNGNSSYYSYDQETGIVGNAYYSSGWKYKTSNRATRYIANIGTHSFEYATSGTANAALTWNTGMYISNAGNVGIGTSSPYVKFDVLAASGQADVAYFKTSDFVPASTGSRFGIGFTGATGNVASLLTATSNGQNEWNDMQFKALNHLFFTNNGERMRITSGGNVMVNTTSNTTGKFTTNGTIASVGSDSGLIWANRGGVGAYTLYSPDGNFSYIFNGGNIAQISMATGVYTPLSDKNKKKDFEESTIGLNAILGLKPTLYRMKSEKETTEKHLGFIAQEVKEFIPQAYSENGDFIGINEMPIIATLVKAIQEQQAQIEELKQLILNK